ncbi:hypothetical protein J4401_03090 [Candidatus Woesearchaeota archaeon]|nr:hypothetical protein [Candidatus Woesearchaeota archaeon]
MKCEICSAKLKEIFLNKIVGTYVKDSKGKKHTVCFDCQRKFGSKEKILAAIK